jgi:homoserine dehydrogenase
VAKLILEQGDRIAAKTGMRLHLARVVDLDTTSARVVPLPPALLTNDLNAVMQDDTIDVGVELIGGTGIARDIHRRLLESGKHVVTANKALLAEHGHELFAIARQHDRCIAFEASCAGGIPIITALRCGLAANDITAMYGIVNGTCNYILSNMSVNNIDFAEALKQAQEKGYAEADSTLDINGVDSAHKLAILASLAFGYDISLEDVFVQGIEGICKDDIHYGAEMGYCLKLLAIGQKRPDGRVSLRVHPSFIDKHSALARVDGSFNAISVFGDAVGQVMFYGRGAGMMPTASAVVADIMDVALGNSMRSFQHIRLRPRSDIAGLIQGMDDLVSRFYIRIMAKDRPGVFAMFGKVLGDHHISISGALQHEGTGPDGSVPVVIVTHETQEKNMVQALQALEALDVISGASVCIRIVDIPEDKEG